MRIIQLGGFSVNVKINKKISALALTLCLLVLAFSLIPTTAHTSASAFMAVANSAEPWTAFAQQVSPHNADDQLTIGLLLRTNRSDEQQALLKALYDPNGAQYH